MKVAILTQYFPPEMGAPQARLSSLAQRFQEMGHEITVLTAMPNYPTGAIYPGFGGLLKESQEKGIRVLRTMIYPTKSLNRTKRLVSYFSFVMAAFWVGLFKLQKMDYVITESPPLFLGMTGYLLSRFKRAKWIFNVSDLWPESAVTLGVLKSGFALSLAQKLEAFFYQKSFLVTCQSHEIEKDIQKRFPSQKTYHLSNGADPKHFELNENQKEKEVRAVYVGLHGLAQGLDQILFAAQKLNGTLLSLHFVGDGAEKEMLVAMARERRIPSVYFHEPVSSEKAHRMLTEADIVIVPLKQAIKGAVPSKLYEAMGAGKPVLLVAEGEAAQVVSKYECGCIVKPGDIQGLADALQRLAQDVSLRQRLGQAGRKALEQDFNRPKIEKKFIHYLEGVL